MAAAPLDALARIFLALGRHYNTNSNQILVVQGDLDLARLRDAVHRAVQRFEHVLIRLDRAGGLWPAAAVPVREIHFAGRCSLQVAAFRELLMDLSEQHRIDWRRQPATQVFLLRSADRQACGVYLNSAHAAADAASDGMLVEEIMAQYGAPRPVAPAPAYRPLERAGPRWWPWGARLARWAAAAVDIARCNLSPDAGLALPGSSRWGYGPADAGAGFTTSVLSVLRMVGVHRAAKHHGVSVNTVFAAALVRLMAARASAPGGAAHRFSLAVSLRWLLPAEGREQAFGNHVLTCTVGQRDDADAHRLVRALHLAVRQLKERRLPLEIGRFELALPLLAAGALQPLVRRAMARAQATNVCYSNPGVLRQNLASFGSPAHPVLEYTGLGCLASPYDLMLYTTTVNGRTQLDALYRRACFGCVESELIRPYRQQLDRLVGELLEQAVEPEELAA